MIHRALFGSIERFFGVLLEHYAGAFPTWLAPVQVRVLAVAEAHEPYAATVVARSPPPVHASTPRRPTTGSASGSATPSSRRSRTCSWSATTTWLRAPSASTLVAARSSGAYRGATCFVVVNIFPYTTGHLLVVPYREVADLDGLAPDETADLWATVTEAVGVVRSVYSPDGLNVGLNLGRPAGGSVPDHLHVHVVPRWTGDSNFMTAISNTQTLPEALVDTATKVRRGWSAGADAHQ
jgi:ATP adenylyltransferase